MPTIKDELLAFCEQHPKFKRKSGQVKQNKLRVEVLQNRPTSTVGDWFRGGNVSDRTKTEVLGWLTAYDAKHTKQPKEKVKEVFSAVKHEVAVWAKVEITKVQLCSLRSLLQWFLVEATAEERSLLLSECPELYDLLNILRGLSSEQARAKILSEFPQIGGKL